MIKGRLITGNVNILQELITDHEVFKLKVDLFEDKYARSSAGESFTINIVNR